MNATKLHKIIKKYKMKLEQHNKEWEAVRMKKHNIQNKGSGYISITRPNIYDHEKHNVKGAQLFKSIMKELEDVEVFPKRKADKLIGLYEEILYGSDGNIGIFYCYDTYYAGCWGKQLKEINKLKKAIK